MARICIIDKQNYNYHAVLSRLDSRQEGLCRLCSERIIENEPIISKITSGRTKYYHKKCAERIHLLWDDLFESNDFLSIANLVLDVYGAAFFKSSSSMSMKITWNKISTRPSTSFPRIHNFNPSFGVGMYNERQLLHCIIRLLHLNCLMLEQHFWPRWCIIRRKGYGL